MKTYTLTPAAQEAFDEWYCKVNITVNKYGIGNCLEAFFQDHPEHLTEHPSTSKRDEVLRVATEIYCHRSITKRSNVMAVTSAFTLIAEVDKRFNTHTP
jgi:hypothetical protein